MHVPTELTTFWKLQSTTLTCSVTPCMHHAAHVNGNALAMQGEIDRLENLIDAHANRADYILEAPQHNIDPTKATLQAPCCF